MRHIASRLVTLATIGAVASLAPVALQSQPATASASTVPVCSASALTLVVGIGGAAAGNLGFPVIITNHGSRTCSLFGFATLSAHTVAKSPHPVTFVHTSRSQIYATAKATLVVLAPKGRASFGVSYVDALDQQYAEGPRCLMDRLTVRLPGVGPLKKATLTFAANGSTYEGRINVCFTGFEFGLTPIVKGTSPPYH